MALTVRDLRFQYEGPLLDGVDLDVPAGTSAFIVGPSGAGKSTILRCVAGLEPVYDGTITLAGRSLAGLAPHERRVGMMFQEPALFPHLTVSRNVSFGLRYRGVPRADWPGEAAHWLELVGLTDRGDAHIDALSGGERQRVALARTLAAKPDAVLLDEPFAALDRDLRERLGAKVRSILHEADVPAVWVTHDEQEATQLGDAVWRLRQGQLVPAAPNPSS